MKNEIKKAALLLSSLSREDEKWILDELAQNQVSNYDSLVEELEGLKRVNGGSNLSSMAMQIKHSEQFESCFKTIQVIDGTEHKKIKKVLNNEPDWVISSLLSFYNWSWKKKYLNAIGIRKRYKLHKLEKNSTSLSYKAKETLVEGLSLQIN